MVKVVTLNDIAEGLLPLRCNLVPDSDKINDTEKVILMELLKDSRVRLKDLARRTRFTQMKILYAIDKLGKKGVIRKFTTCVQNPDKRLFVFFSVNIIPTEDHKPVLQSVLINNIIKGEKIGVTNDYSVIYDTFGHFDSVFFCNFENGIELDNRGPGLLNRLWKNENPIFEKAILTQVIVGKWPFNTNGYTGLRSVMKIISSAKYNILK